MGKSGNPMRQAAKQQTQVTVKEVKAAVAAGRKPVVQWTDSTRILIESTEPDEAATLVRVLQNNYDPIGAVTFLHHWMLMCQVLADDPASRRELAITLAGMNQEFDMAVAQSDERIAKNGRTPGKPSFIPLDQVWRGRDDD